MPNQSVPPPNFTDRQSITVTEQKKQDAENADTPAGGDQKLDGAGEAVPPTAAQPLRRSAKERTVQVSLRLPANWVALLRQRAFAAAAAEDTMITPQEIVRRMIADSLDQK